MPHMSTSSNKPQSKCENGMGEAEKRKEMVEDKSCEKSVSDKGVCGSLCVKELYVTRLCERLCVQEMWVNKFCVKELCVNVCV